MASEWHQHQVSELIERGALFVGDGYRAKNDELSSSGLPFARAGNINEGFRFGDADHFPEENIGRIGNKVSQPGDVVFTSKGTVGRFAFVRPATPRFVYSPQLCFWRSLDPKLVDPRFLFFWMFGREFFVQFKGVAGQTDMADYVNLTDQRRMHITLPPLPEQRAIAHILGTLDDKIELNRRMNETLEAMARALFKSWFVDFLPVRAKMAARENDPSLLLPQAEPNTWSVYAIECNDGSLYIGQTEDLRQRWLQHVGGRGGSWTKQHPPVRVSYWERQPSREAAVERENWLKTGYGRKWLKKEIAARTQTGDPVRAKAEGRDPGLPKPIADLFPDRFEYSELGEIPAGWSFVPLPEVIEVNPLRALRRGEVAPYLDMANMPTHGHSPDAVVARPFGSGMRFINGDTLVARITPCLENGKTAYVDFLEEGQVAWGSTEYIVLRPKSPLPTEFAYCLARSDEFREFAIQSMTGSSGRQRVPAESLSHFLVTSPSRQVAARFGKLVKPLFGRSSAATGEGSSLAALRDTLLPRLISGELQLKVGETIIEEAV